MKVIIVDEYLKFINSDTHAETFSIIHAFKTGYWNVYKFNEGFEKYLKDKKIAYKVTETDQNW